MNKKKFFTVTIKHVQRFSSRVIVMAESAEKARKQVEDEWNNNEYLYEKTTDNPDEVETSFTDEAPVSVTALWREFNNCLHSESIPKNNCKVVNANGVCHEFIAFTKFQAVKKFEEYIRNMAPCLLENLKKRKDFDEIVKKGFDVSTNEDGIGTSFFWTSPDGMKWKLEMGPDDSFVRTELADIISIDVKGQDGKHYQLVFNKDCDENIDGFWVEVYEGNGAGDRIHDFCIHMDDCDCTDTDAVKECAIEKFKELNF